jgi:hypothetical protein
MKKRKKLEDGLLFSIDVIFLSSSLIVTEELQDAGRTIGQKQTVVQ